MPRGTKTKKKRERNALPPDLACACDEDSESVCSSQDGSVLSDDGVPGVVLGGAEEVEEGDVQSQLAEQVDLLGDKNSRTRLAAMESINKVLRERVVADHLTGSVETITDAIVRGLKKVKGGERCSLLQLAMLLTAQLGAGHPELLVALKPVMAQLMGDPSVSALERAECVRTLSLCSFIQAPDTLEVSSVMHDCEQLFQSRLEPVVASAVHSWSLLLSITPNTSIPPIMQSLLPVLNGLLGRPEMSVRIAVGQAVALLFELARETDEEPLDSSDGSESFELIQQLATESNRYTARKDRNQQRACFRDILQTVEDGSVPNRDVKVGIETLSLDSWAKLIQYGAFKDLLGSGMNTHIQGNDLLREVFQLGPTPLVSRESIKASRLEKKYYNAAVAKHRSQSRSKQRDKRAVI